MHRWIWPAASHWRSDKVLLCPPNCEIAFGDPRQHALFVKCHKAKLNHKLSFVAARVLLKCYNLLLYREKAKAVEML